MSGSLNRKLFLDGLDVSSYLSRISVGSIEKPSWGTIPVSGVASFEMIGVNQEWRPNNPASFFAGRRFRDMELVLTQGGNPRWKGVVSDATSDPGSNLAQISGESFLVKVLNRKGRVDSDQVTPAEAARRLLVLQGAKVNLESFTRASSILQQIPVLVQVSPPVLNYDGTTADILQVLAKAGLLRFSVNESDEVVCETWTDDFPPTVIPIIDDRLIQSQVAQEGIQFQPVDGYKITWFQDVLETSISDNVITMDFGPTDTVQMMDIGSAIYCGEQWTKLHAKEWTKLSVSVDRDFGLSVLRDKWLFLDSKLMKIEAPFLVDGYDDSDARWVTIFGRMDKDLLRTW